MNKKVTVVSALLIISLLTGIAAYCFMSPQNQLPLSGQVIVYYDDGTSTPYSFSGLAPLTITETSTGKTVNSVQISLYGTPMFTGTVSSWTVNGASNVYLKSSSGSVLSTLASNSPITTPSWAGPISSGQTVTLMSSSITAAQLESLYSGWQLGSQYQYVFSLTSLSMTLNANTGETATKTAVTADLSWRFTYGGGFTFQSLSVNWSVNAY